MGIGLSADARMGIVSMSDRPMANARLRPPADSYWARLEPQGFTAWVEQHRLPDMRICSFAHTVFFHPSEVRPRSKARSYASEGME